MTPERYEQIGQLYDAALELAPGERTALLERACGVDEELRREVESLLEAHEQAGDFIASPAVEMAAGLLTDQDAPSLVGRKISHYQVLSLLAVGGMGEVYLAQDTQLGRKVALKLLLKEFTHDPERVRRFEREARAASALNHPNILTIYEIGRADGIDFIAAEFIEGETLRAYMARTRMRLKEAIDVAAQVADALSAAHAAGVVHRDIKPENIMVRRDHIVKVLDFGLTKLAEKAGPATQRQIVNSEAGSKMAVNTEPGLVLGTVSYMSPEQSQGSARVDHRTDIWSLGVVLYEMVTGRVPFEGKDIYRQVIAIQESEPPPLSRYAGGVPERLEEIVQKTLAKDPNERYQTARGLLIDLRHLRRKLEVDEEMARSAAHQWQGTSGAVKNSGPQAAAATGPHSAARTAALEQPHPTSSAEVIVGEIKRHQRGFGVALAVLIVLAAGVVFWLYRWLSQDQPQNRAAGPAPKIIPFTSFPGVEAEPSFSPDGNQIAFAWNGGSGDNYDIYVKLLDTGTPLRLTSNADADRFPAWSPDGRSIAFLRLSENENSIVLIPALGGPERVLHSATSVEFPAVGYGLSWSPDGKFLAFPGRESQREPSSIYSLSIESLERRKLTSPHAGTLGDVSPAISPDGNTLAFIRWHSTVAGEIHLAPVAGGEPKRLTFDNRGINAFAWTGDGREIIFSSNRGGTHSLWRIPTSGGPPERLAAGGENPSSPAIARQGQRLAYAQWLTDTNIWRIEAPRATGRSRPPTKFISSTRRDDSPQFSPDGKRIAFASTRSGDYEVWMCDADGSNLVQLTSFGGPHVGSPRWSSDGRQIAFAHLTEGHQDIYVVGTGGGQPRRLTVEPSDEVRPSWSRDGRFIYFASNRSGDWQVWKAPVAGGPAVQVTKQGGREAFESPDGKFVYYSKGADIFGLWRVPVEGGEEGKLLDHVTQGFWAVLEQGIYFINLQVRPHPAIEFFNFATGRTTQIATVDKALLWAGPGLAVSPDGRWILYVQVDQVESDIMLVEHFK